MASPSGNNPGDEEMDLKLDELFKKVNKHLGKKKGSMWMEAQDYYKLGKQFSGDEKMYYLHLLASISDEL